VEQDILYWRDLAKGAHISGKNHLKKFFLDDEFIYHYSSTNADGLLKSYL
jgi:hypothetical protein